MIFICNNIFFILSLLPLKDDIVSTINGIEVHIYDLKTLNGTGWLNDRV